MTRKCLICVIVMSMLICIYGTGYALEHNVTDLTNDDTFSHPYGLCTDGEGNLIVVDSFNHSIKMVSDGIATIIAGNPDIVNEQGQSLGGFKDGDCLQARFNKPRDADVDTFGTIFVADTDNNMIRAIKKGRVYTVAGDLKKGYMDGKSQEARFNMPTGLAVDKKGNIYVADTLNHVIRKITPNAGVTTFAGAKTELGGYKDGAVSNALFNEPSDIVIDEAGIMYVLDTGNQVIRRIEKGEVTTFAGTNKKLISGSTYYQGGYQDGEEGQFNFPKGMCITSEGYLLVADTYNHAIRKVNLNRKVETIGGTGVFGNRQGLQSKARFYYPSSIIQIKDSIYVADTWNNTIKVMPYSIKAINTTVDLIENIKRMPKSEEIRVWVDGKEVNFKDVKPIRKDKTIFMPIRQILEKSGFSVNWLDEKKEVEVSNGDQLYTFNIDKEDFFIVRGRTLIELRFFNNIFNTKTRWLPEYNALIIE